MNTLPTVGHGILFTDSPLIPVGHGLPFTEQVKNPATGKVLAQMPLMRADETRAAVAAAHSVFPQVRREQVWDTSVAGMSGMGINVVRVWNEGAGREL